MMALLFSVFFAYDLGYLAVLLVSGRIVLFGTFSVIKRKSSVPNKGVQYEAVIFFSYVYFCL